MASVETAIVTFNCGRQLADPHVLAGHLARALAGRAAPELLVLSLQEVAPIAYAFLGGVLLGPYMDRFRAAVDLLAKAGWADSTGTPSTRAPHKGASSNGAAPSYVLLAAHNVGMTAVLAFVRGDRAGCVVGPTQAGGVGVGWLSAGNKGAVGVRVGWAGTPGAPPAGLTFVAAHLAPMEWHVERRNDDWRRIVEGLVFTTRGTSAVQPRVEAEGHAGSDARNDDDDEADESAPLLRAGGSTRQPPPAAGSEAGIYDTRSWVFVAGDLNYRTHDGPPTADESAQLARSPAALDRDKLWAGDQLRRELAARRTLHGFRELPVAFAPTYKHSPAARQAARRRETERAAGAETSAAGAAGTAAGAATADDDANVPTAWSRHRWPSWCDRVLFWSAGGAGAEPAAPLYAALPLLSSSDHQPVVWAAAVPLAPPATENAGDPSPYRIDPSWRSRRSAARLREIAIGLTAYLALTWEGNGLVLAVTVGALGGWALVHNLVAA